MKRIVWTLLAATSVCLRAGGSQLVATGALEAYRLRCEEAADPVGVACAQPRLTWSLRGNEPAARPVFAEVRLAAAGADLGSVPVRKSSDLFSYACPALESGIEYCSIPSPSIIH